MKNEPLIIEGKAQFVNQTYFIPKTRAEIRRDINTIVFNMLALTTKWLVIMALILALLVEICGA